jgi:hypothetical protein
MQTSSTWRAQNYSLPFAGRFQFNSATFNPFGEAAFWHSRQARWFSRYKPNCHHCCENWLPTVAVTNAEREILGAKSKRACKTTVENILAYHEAQALGAYRGVS